MSLSCRLLQELQVFGLEPGAVWRPVTRWALRRRVEGSLKRRLSPRLECRTEDPWAKHGKAMGWKKNTGGVQTEGWRVGTKQEHQNG